MASELKNAIVGFLNHADRMDAEKVEALRVLVCRLALVVVPDVQTKVYEYIVASEIGATVCKKNTGPDLLTAAGRPLEVKMSREAKKVNFAWPIPVGRTVDERRQKLVESARLKGDGVCVVIDSDARVLERYQLKQEFLAGLFWRWPLTKKMSKVNLGSTWCFSCKRCPRMDRFLEASVKFPKVTEEEWAELLTPMKPHVCPAK